MKLPELKGYKDTDYDATDSNPSTINNILGIKQASFKGLLPETAEDKVGVPTEAKDKDMLDLADTNNSANSVKEKMPESFDFAKDQEMRRKDIHVNHGHAHDDVKTQKDLRVEDAYAFLNTEVEDIYTDEEYSVKGMVKVGATVGAATGAAAGVATLGYNVINKIKANKKAGKKWNDGISKDELKGVGRNTAIGLAAGTAVGALGSGGYYAKKKRDSDKEADLSNTDKFSDEDDNYAPGDGIVKVIKNARYLRSNVVGSMWGSRKYANKVDQARRTHQIINGAAGVASAKTGIDKDALTAVGHMAHDAGKTGYKKAGDTYDKWKAKRKVSKA